MYGRALWTILIGMIIPLIGIAVSQLVLGAASGLAAGPSEFFYLRPTVEMAAAACANGGESIFCGEVERAGWLRLISLWTAAALAAIVILFMLLALIAGGNRRLNVAIFPPLMPIATLSIGLLIFIHGAMITYCVYIAELWFLDRTYYVAPGFAGLVALIGATQMMSALRQANAEHPNDVLARPLSREEQPRLWAYVEEIADKLGARRPDHILVGFEPTFFATAAPVRVPEANAMLTGETLYLSLPLLRLFNENELRAVVAHELGHFRELDVQYSLTFAPVYRRLALAIYALEGDDGKADWITHAPGALMLRFMLEAFERNRNRISRDREFAADQASMEVADADGVGLALAKSVVFGMLWQKTRIDNVHRLREGKISPNLAKVFEKSALYDVSHAVLGDIVGQVLTHRITHPTDTHPPIAERYEAVGFDPQAGLTIGALTTPGRVSDALFVELEELERSLTVIEHKLMVASGVVEPPEGGEEFDPILEAAYVMAVAMVGADGVVDPEEIAIAEGIGARLFQNFDPVSFRERFDQLEELPSFDSAAAILDEILVQANKKRVFAYLMEIAAADGDLHNAERELLNRAAARWNVGRPLELRLPGRSESRKDKSLAPESS